MKRIFSLAVCALAAVCAWAADAPVKPWQYTDAQQLRVINKGFKDTDGPYTRIPAALKDSVRPTLWDRTQCSAGIAVRFATNSSRIGVRYNLLTDAHMLHMADTGIKGTDLYVLDRGKWRYVNTNRPKLEDKETKRVEAKYVDNLDTTQMHEYMIYFPLYDGVTKMEVKTDAGSAITPGDYSKIDAKRRIVGYGTSIMQGGCASRTGMCATNMLSRELNCEFINIGNSGEGKMDPCMARALAAIKDVDMYIIDPVPNCTEMMCDTLTYDFVNIIRKAHPNTPIVMVEGPLYSYHRYDSFYGKYLPAKNAAFRRNYEKLKAENPKNIYYVDYVELDGPDHEGTVDGIHLTDLGFRHYADKLKPVIKTVLGW